MQDITAPYEYVVAEKVTGKLRLRRAGLILLYILFLFHTWADSCVLY